ncbi:hypothetical protein CYY_009857 [Polysphondylium violaceum]|uniref:Uncharacterized protein n=1 Tax=Polysphondylium violaceum TaxID=133409 RepID=A0A8J4V2J5_9MYCE|nr:hypothetical protein CYY_009857 [Polysphondylium violaceum]
MTNNISIVTLKSFLEDNKPISKSLVCENNALKREQIKNNSNNDQTTDNAPQSMQLSSYLVKMIIEMSFGRDKLEDDYEIYGGKARYDGALNYAMVNKQWFKITQQLVNSYALFDLSDIDMLDDKQHRLTQKRLLGNLRIELLEIGNTNFDIDSLVRSLPSLKTIQVHMDYQDVLDSIKPFNLLDKLNGLKDYGVSVKFNLAIADIREFGKVFDVKEIQDQPPFLFQTDVVQVVFGDQNYKSDGFVYQLIKSANPKSIVIYSDYIFTGKYAEHLKIYHSLAKLLSKLDRCTSIEIDIEFVPLYALYRFLQAPSIKKIDIKLEFHFLSNMYKEEENKDTNDPSWNFNFKESDNFTFQIEPQGPYQAPQGLLSKPINEDNQFHCSVHSLPEIIPSYSFSLWKSTLQELKNNKTLTDLTIGNFLCLCMQENFEMTDLNDQKPLIGSLLEALSENKSIKRLTFDFDWTFIHGTHPFVNEEFIHSLLSTNSTLESLTILQYEESIEKKVWLDFNDKCTIYLRTKKPRIGMAQKHEFVD